MPIDRLIDTRYVKLNSYGKIKATLESKGARLDDLDLIIAAIALTRNLTLVTNNQKHFSRIQGLKLTIWAQ